MELNLSEVWMTTLKAGSERLIMECVGRLSEKYGFDASEARKLLNLGEMVVTIKSSGSRKEKARKESKESKESKDSKILKEKVLKIPLPFEASLVSELGCCGLAYNEGLMTQCQKSRKDSDSSSYCGTCQTEADKSATGKPPMGTVADRLTALSTEVEYQDSKGRKPVQYRSILERRGITREMAETEAGKYNCILSSYHFEEIVEKEKAGRPKSQKKKAVNAETVEDLFASLVLDTTLELALDSDADTVLMTESESEQESDGVKEKVVRKEKKEKAVRKEKVVKTQEEIEEAEMEKLERSSMSSEDSDTKKIEKAEKMKVTRALKESQLALEKQLKAEQLILEKGLKELKLIEEKEQKEAKILADKVAKEAEKVAKAAKILADKAEKEAKILADKAEKETAKEVEKEAKSAKILADKEAKEAKILADKEAKEAKILADKEAKSLKIATEKMSKDKKLTKAVVATVPVKAVADADVKEAKKTTSVQKIKINSVEYYISRATCILYTVPNDDEKSVPVGIYDEKTKTIKKIPKEEEEEEEEDEISDDEYESDQ